MIHPINPKLKVLFCGARKLGMDCLQELYKFHNRDIEIIGAVVPKKNEKVWWNDSVDEDEVTRMNIRLFDLDEALRLKNLDLVISVLHGPIFKEPFISWVKYGILNLHPAPLPYYRGANGGAHAIINGEKKFGISLHYIDEGIDTGPIIDIYWLKIKPDDTGKSLYKRTHDLGKQLFKDKIKLVIKEAKKGKKVSAQKQNNSQANYYPRNSLSNKEINLLKSYKQIYNFVRALQFTPFEPAYFKYKGKKIHLKINNGNLIISKLETLKE